MTNLIDFLPRDYLRLSVRRREKQRRRIVLVVFLLLAGLGVLQQWRQASALAHQLEKAREQRQTASPMSRAISGVKNIGDSTSVATFLFQLEEA